MKKRTKIIIAAIPLIIFSVFIFDTLLFIIFQMQATDLLLPPNDIGSRPTVNLNDVANDNEYNEANYYKMELGMWKAEADVDATEQYLSPFGAKRIIGPEFENEKDDYMLTKIENPDKEYQLNSIFNYAVSRDGLAAVFVNTGHFPLANHEGHVLMICDTNTNEKTYFVTSEKSSFNSLPLEYALFYDDMLLVITDAYDEEKGGCICPLYDRNGNLIALYNLSRIPDEASWWNYKLCHTRIFGNNKYYITSIKGTVGRVYKHEHYRYLIHDNKDGESTVLLDFKKGFYTSALLQMLWITWSIGATALFFGYKYKVGERLKKWLNE